MEKPINRILVIKLRAIGDVVLATAVLPNLRRAFPRAEIHFMTEKPSLDAVRGNPFVDRVLSVPPDPLAKPLRMSSWKAFIRCIRGLRNANYDMILDLFGNPKSAWLTWFSGAPVRAGFNFRGRKFAYNEKITPRGDRVHEVEFNLDAVRAVGVPVVYRRPFFSFSGKDEAVIDRWIEQNGLHRKFRIALHFWGSWEAKRWGLEHFAGLAERLVQKYHARVILLWGPGEKAQAERIQRLTGRQAILAPTMTLKQLGALLSKCRLVVANDSGPMHIAAAVGTPTVGIFGPTAWKLQGPYGKHSVAVYKKDLACLGCNRLKCNRMTCMTALGVGEVMRAVEKVLGDTKR